MSSNAHLGPARLVRLAVVAAGRLANTLDRLVSTQRSRGQIVLALLVVAAILVALFAFSGLADWTDDHSTTIQGLAVIALAVTTAMYMLYTRELVVRTREQRGPYVYFEVKTRGALLDSCITNAGERGAENVRIEVQQDVTALGGQERGLLGWPLFREPIPFLPPGRSVSRLASNLQSVVPKLRDLPPERRVVRYTIRYSDGPDRYTRSYSYDLSFLTSVGDDPFPLAGDRLGQIDRRLETLTKVVGERLDSIKGNLHSIGDAISRQGQP